MEKLFPLFLRKLSNNPYILISFLEDPDIRSVLADTTQFNILGYAIREKIDSLVSILFTRQEIGIWLESYVLIATIELDKREYFERIIGIASHREDILNPKSRSLVPILAAISSPDSYYFYRILDYPEGIKSLESRDGYPLAVAYRTRKWELFEHILQFPNAARYICPKSVKLPMNTVLYLAVQRKDNDNFIRLAGMVPDDFLIENKHTSTSLLALMSNRKDCLPMLRYFMKRIKGKPLKEYLEKIIDQLFSTDLLPDEVSDFLFGIVEVDEYLLESGQVIIKRVINSPDRVFEKFANDERHVHLLNGKEIMDCLFYISDMPGSVCKERLDRFLEKETIRKRILELKDPKILNQIIPCLNHKNQRQYNGISEDFIHRLLSYPEMLPNIEKLVDPTYLIRIIHCTDIMEPIFTHPSMTYFLDRLDSKGNSFLYYFVERLFKTPMTSPEFGTLKNIVQYILNTPKGRVLLDLKNNRKKSPRDMLNSNLIQCRDLKF